MALIKDILRTMDYGPSPEGSEHVRAWLEEHKSGFGLFINGAFTKPQRPVRRLQSGDRRADRARDAGLAGGRRRRGRRGAEGASQMGGALRLRALEASLCARAPRAEARALPFGAGNDRQRQADPRVARHRHSARRPPLLPSCGLGLADRQRVSGNQAGRRLRADHPVELSAADARLEDRAGARGRQHGRAEAGGIYAADRARLRRDLRRSGAAARASSTSSPATARPARRSSPMPASTRSPSPARPRSAARSARRPPARARSCRSSSAASRRSSCSRTPTSTARSRASVDAIWFNQGQVCCAGSRLLVAESVAEALYAKLRARMANLRVGDPLDKSTDVGAIVAPAQLERIQRLMREGEQEGLEFWRADDSLPDARLLLSADARHRRRARVDPRARGNLRPGAGRHDLPHAGRSGRARQQHPLRPRGFRLDREHQSRARGRGPHQGRRRLDQFDQHVRRRLGLRRLSRKRLRPRGRARGPARVPHRRRAEGEAELGEAGAPQRRARARPAGAIASAALDRTAKLYIGGKQARPDSGYSYAVLDPAGREVGLAGLGNRKDIRNAVEAAAKASSWGAATAHNRAQVLYYVSREFERAGGRIRAAPERDDRRLGPRGARPRSRLRSAAPFSTRASPTSSTARFTRRARASSRWR